MKTSQISLKYCFQTCVSVFVFNSRASKLVQVDGIAGCSVLGGGVAGCGECRPPGESCAGSSPAFRVIDRRRLPATTLTSLMGRWFCCATVIDSLAWKEEALVKLREVSLSGSGTFQTFYCIQIPLCTDGWWPDEVKKDYVAKWSFAMESYHNSSTCPPSRED